MSKLVTLASFDNSIDAHLLRTKLESEEIPCFIFDENMVTLNPLNNITVGGVKVKVMEEDLDAARNILDLLYNGPAQRILSGSGQDRPPGMLLLAGNTSC